MTVLVGMLLVGYAIKTFSKVIWEVLTGIAKGLLTALWFVVSFFKKKN